MIINSIHITVFAGLSGRDIKFEQGINVVLGPNEAGKSTIFRALENTLFTPADLTPSRFQRLMGHYLPIGGGDTIEAMIHFSHSGENYELKRSWGATASSKLTLPGGAVITDDEKIQVEIESCIQVPEGTCKNVMMTYQSGLTQTLDNLREDTDTQQSFGDLMRTVVMEMDGVSVDAFKAAVEEQHKTYTKRWDFDAEYPEKNRGVNNQYKIDIGTIVKAFYTKEELKKDLEDAESFERDMDKVNGHIREAVKALEKNDAFIKEHKKARGDAEKRSRLGAELNTFELKIEKLKKVNKDWPVAEQKIKDIEIQLPKLEKKEIEFTKERDIAQKAEDSRDLLSQYERAKAKKEKLEAAEKKLKETQKLTADDLQTIREIAAEITRLKTSLSAGKLYVKLRAKKALSLKSQEGFSDESAQKVKKGKTLEWDAEGRLKLEHEDWTLEASSGEDNYKDLMAQHEEVKQSLEKQLKKLKVDSMEQAETVYEAYARLRQDIETAQDNLQAELDEETFSDLEKHVKKIDVPDKIRKAAAVVEDLMRTENEINELKEDRDEYKEKITGWIEEYTDADDLLLALAELTGGKKKKTTEIEGLAPLPDGVDADDFIEKYDLAEEDYDDAKDEKNRLILEKSQLEAEALESSVEEYEKELREAKDAFALELKKGRNIARIQDVMDDLLDEMDSGTYQSLQDDVAQYTARMTDNRYAEIEMDESLPAGLHRADGEVIAYDRLSEGTQDVLSIALKLAMADKYLEDREGFIIMDDPFVDLDPQRQERAAAVIRDFAEGKQVILFTCHPAHAKLLGGRTIELNSTGKKAK
ncbi:MAG: AAA family ATPase [Candidatus Marinimicrobia bacterium]|nr:AAA family ATPase [Candidatus Neomarinimicrobiota bacterium]